jgi:5-methylthioadenosine/S-adenosylhomocysteine deaminase
VLCFTKLAILEYLSSGITSAFDMYFHFDAIAQAAIETGFRMVLCGAVNDFGGTAAGMKEEFTKFNKLNPLISYRLGFHAEFTTALPLMKDIALLANELKQPIAVHNSETRDEVIGCYERHSKSPTAIMDELGMWNFGGASFHCVYCNERDMELFRERGIYCVTNGGSNVKLASGIPPLMAFKAAGVSLAIGTDGAASNNCLDFFREMFLMTGLQKLRESNACTMSAHEVLKAAALGGAGAMGLVNCGELKIGKQADIIMIDLNRPNMQPINHPLENLVYSGSKENIAMTMIAGKILYEKGEFIGIDTEKLYAEANDRAKRIRS